MEQLRQLLHGDHLPFGLPVRCGGDAEHRSLVWDVADDAGLRADGGLMAQLRFNRIGPRSNIRQSALSLFSVPQPPRADARLNSFDANDRRNLQQPRGVCGFD